MTCSTFFAQTDVDGVARYRIVIPILGALNGCHLEAKTETGEPLTVAVSDLGEGIVERADRPGHWKVIVSLVDPSGAAMDQQTIEAVVSETPSPELVTDIEKALGEIPANLFAALGTGTARALAGIGARTSGGEDLAVVCERFARPGADANDRLRCLRYLDTAARGPNLRRQAAALQQVVQMALTQGLPALLSTALSLLDRLPISTVARYQVLLAGLTAPAANEDQLNAVAGRLVAVTPGAEIGRTAGLIAGVLDRASSDALRNTCINTLRELGCRETASHLRELVVCAPRGTPATNAMKLLREWGDAEAGPAILELLDVTTDVAAAKEAVAALRAIGARDLLLRLRAMIPMASVAKAKVIESGIAGWN